VRVFRRRRNPPGARTLGYLVSFQVTRRRRNRSGVSQSPISRAAIRWRIQISSCTRPPMGAVRQPGPRLDNRGRSVDNFITDPPPRCRRTAPASPTEIASGGRPLFALDFASKCAIPQTPHIATWVQAERRRRAVGRTAWMPRERRQDMDVRSARAHGASPSLRYSDEGGTQPGARTLGYLVSFQVTRRRRNRSGVSQSPTSRAAITWRIQISSCTRNPMGDAEVVLQQRSGGSDASSAK
jgi:hypothetical protein